MREKAQRSQASFEKHDSGGRLTWLGAILCTFFPHRRFSLYDSGAENPSPTPHRQAEIDLGALPHRGRRPFAAPAICRKSTASLNSQTPRRCA